MVKTPLHVPVEILIRDYKPVIKSLAMELDSRVIGVQGSLVNVAAKIQRLAKANAAKRHDLGRLEENIEWWQSFESPTYIRYSVGIKPGKFVPEGATFEKGWFSKQGKQPPTAPIAEWALRRGLTSKVSSANAIGFIIAKRQGERPGYTFGQFHWLKDAFDAEAPNALATAVYYGLKSHSSYAQGRNASGQFTSFMH